MIIRKTAHGRWMAAFLCLACLAPLPATAQADAMPAAGIGRSEAALSALAESLRQVNEELKAAHEKLNTKLSADDQTRVEGSVKSLAAKRETLMRDLELVVTGVDPQSLNAPAGQELNLQDETRELLLPIIQELKQLTASPREAEGLRRQLADLRHRHQLAESSLQKLETQIKVTNDATLKPLLEELLNQWKKRQSDADTELAVAEYKLEELEEKRGGVLSALRGVAAGFFRQRGRNLLLAFVISLMIFGGMRLLWQRLNKLPALKRKNRTFGVRIAVVGYHGLSLLLSVFSVLLVFYLAGDWVLMGLAVLFLIGLAWTGKQTLPAVYEQVKLLLNLGSVREGERVIYNGLPWEVRSVGVFSDLRNPALEGGHIRLPLKELTTLVSRPDEGEVWFPCAADEWVCLSDGTHGKVVTQTPDWVHLVLLGGSRRTYPTQTFLQMCPENLAKSFRVRSVFGIDYRHQSICTTEVPQKLKLHIERELRALIGAEHLKNVTVELSEAGSSALNYTVLADFAGDVAQRYAYIARVIQRLCVDACNENAWNIPFNQLTLHQGEPA